MLPSAGWATPNGLRKISGASAPAIAISEPTERSMPPVAITSVMPTETMTMVATCVRLTLSVWKLAKCGVTSEIEGEQHDQRGQRGVAPQEGQDVGRGAPALQGRRVSHRKPPPSPRRPHAPWRP